MPTQTCRYCGESFVPRPKKPGFVDECPGCLHERTRPAIPPDFASKFASRFPERKRALNALRKQLKTLGIEESKVFEAMASEMKKSGTQI
jgi:hypothetical protein